LLLRLLQPLPYAALGEENRHFIPTLRLDGVEATIDFILVKKEHATRRRESLQQGEGHFLIRLDSDSLDMGRAQQIVDIISAAIVVVAPGDLLDRDLIVVPIPVELVSFDGSFYKVYEGDILALGQAEPIWKYFDEVGLRLELSSGMMFPGSTHEEIWGLLSVFVDQSLRKAALLYLESLRAYPVVLCAEERLQIDLYQPPPSLRDQTALENAFHQAFKAVEVLLGGPLPKEDRKLQHKLFKLKLKPDTELSRNKILIEIVREVEAARDRRAAHGKPYQEPFAFWEVAESQRLARFMITEIGRNTRDWEV